MSKYNVWAADRVYIKKDIITNISDFKLEFTHKIKDKILYEFVNYAGQDIMAIPIGYLHKIPNLTKGELCIKDMRVSKRINDITIMDFNGELRPDQEKLLEEWYSRGVTSGIIVAKAGFGKTVIASHLICSYRLPTLIIVPTIMILKQWVTSISKFTKISPAIIAGGVFDVGIITIACAKSIIRRPAIDKLKKEFSLIIVDEAHTACAPKVREVINSMYAKYKIGLTATPFRKDNTHFHLAGLFGPNSIESTSMGMKALIRRVHADETFLFNSKCDYITALTKLSRNTVFAYDVALTISSDFIRKRKIIVLSPRIEHLELIMENLTNRCIPCGRLVSARNKQEEKDNKELLIKMSMGECVLFGTYQLIGTGFDAPILDCMHLPYSYNNKGLFIQLVGRIERTFTDKPEPELVEYIFKYKDFTAIQQRSREQHYKELGYKVQDEYIEHEDEFQPNYY